MAGLILVGRCLQSLPFYEGWHAVPEQGAKGMISRRFHLGAKLSEQFR